MQECEGREQEVAANIGSDYAVAGSASAGHSVIYRTSVFSFQGQGTADLNEMDQYGRVSFCTISERYKTHHTITKSTISKLLL